jgi:glucose/arabinose dehydrogenase
MALLMVALLLNNVVPKAHAADDIFFKETGQTLSDKHGFLSYWQSHGGLPQFGYPLTPEILEVNPADQKTYIVQWFERNRFEWHPENKGTQYEVLLGLLGKQLTIGRENEGAFRRFDDMHYPNGRYFPETGHNLRNSFRGYWESNGGLFAYGYPITEEFEEVNPSDGKTYVVQWFERARFEYHPENKGSRYEVLLGLLGDQIVGDPNLPDPPAASVANKLIVPDKYKNNPPFNVERTIKLPPGFKISVFAATMTDPRFMTVAPNGDIFISERNLGKVRVLVDRSHTGTVQNIETFAEGLYYPHGLAFYNGYLYVAEENEVVRYPYTAGDTIARGPKEVIVSDLPTGKGQELLNGHNTRTIIFGPDGKMYVSVGSSCDTCVETNSKRATILQYNPDGSGGRVYASGIRNAVGINFDPKTNLLWATGMGRNDLGDNYPPDYLTPIREGGNYGWPYCQGVPLQPDPQFGGGKESFCASADSPLIALPAHIAPLGLAFYDKEKGPLPDIYQNGMFVGYHGSLQRSTHYGYSLNFVSMRPGRLQKGPQEFATGWLNSPTPLPDGSPDSWGRPVDVVIGQDGAIYLSDDKAGAVYRISYQ